MASRHSLYLRPYGPYRSRRGEPTPNETIWTNPFRFKQIARKRQKPCQRAYRACFQRDRAREGLEVGLSARNATASMNLLQAVQCRQTNGPEVWHSPVPTASGRGWRTEVAGRRRPRGPECVGTKLECALESISQAMPSRIGVHSQGFSRGGERAAGCGWRGRMRPGARSMWE